MSRLSRVSRAGLGRRVLAVTDLTDVARAERRLASVEAAIAENATLAVLLEEQVAQTERAVLEVMERAEARRVG